MNNTEITLNGRLWQQSLFAEVRTSKHKFTDQKYRQMCERSKEGMEGKLQLDYNYIRPLEPWLLSFADDPSIS